MADGQKIEIIAASKLCASSARPPAKLSANCQTVNGHHITPFLPALRHNH